MTNAQATAALRHLVHFLTARGWTRVSDGTYFSKYAGPELLRLPPEFTLAIPRSGDAPDVDIVLQRIISLLADIYDRH